LTGAALFWELFAASGSRTEDVSDNPAENGTYTKIFDSSRTVNEGDGFFSSGPVMLTLDAGVYYLIGT